MTKNSAIYFAVLAAVSATSALAEPRESPELIVIGPVEAVDLVSHTATVLGQRFLISNTEALVVGNAASVYGVPRADGTIQVSAVRDQGLYTAGATQVFLSGLVQKSEASIGSAVVNGIKIDLTGAMADGQISPALGARMAISGTQPVRGGVVLAAGIIGSGAAANGIIGSGAAANGIIGSGAAANGIIGSGARANSAGIIGSGASANGIIGSGIHPSSAGIIGSGAAANGIIGSGAAANGIIGSGAAANGIIGSGARANSTGIIGSGAS